ncbi:nucleoside monophosphate kinase, partial [Acidobacteria bacterium AH-259-D05]|nr:nucleoside monophosphate kinase [Acidobacteria bacterium AH-259-D05]
QILREEVRAGTALGNEAREIMEKGNLVPDHVVAEVVRERIVAAGQSRGVLLDGFPRNLSQANLLDKFQGETPLLVISIRVDEEEVLKRLSGRRYCVDCGKIYNFYSSPPKKENVCDVCGAKLIQREDDGEEIIYQRLQVYREETEPLINVYSKADNYFEVDGNQDAQSVFEEISVKLQEYSGQPVIRQ